MELFRKKDSRFRSGRRRVLRGCDSCHKTDDTGEIIFANGGNK